MTKRKFNRYPAYKDSGVEWLGEIPAHWRALALKRIGDLQAGAGFPEDEQGIQDEETPFFKVGDMGAPGNERELLVHQHSVSRATARRLRANVFAAGTIVFAKVGAALLLNRRRLIARPSCIDNNMMGFMPDDCDTIWALYWLTGLDMGRLANPGAVPSVNEGQMCETPAAVPPLPEQRAIAAFLDRETARIDALVAKKERLIELLQEQRTALITRAVTKGLDPHAPMKDSGVEWQGDVATHWEVKRIKFIAQVGNGSTPNRDNSEYWGGEYPWLNSGVVNLAEVTEGSDFVTELALAECHLPRIHPPAVLVGITGEGRTRGMATVLHIEATINQHLAFIRPTRAHSDAEYTRYVLHAAYQFLRNESGGGGSTKGALTCDQLGNVSIPIPPVPEQRAISAFLDRETARIDALIAKVREAIERLKELRTALISAAVTGKIDVREEVA